MIESSYLACPGCRMELSDLPDRLRCTACGLDYQKHPAGYLDFLQDDSASEYDAEYFAAREYDDIDPYLKAMFNATFRSVNPGPLRVLDAGCGRGVYTNFYRSLGHEVVPLDASVPGAQFSKGVRGSILQLPFRRETFDVVVAAHVLEHLTDAEIGIYLAECRRVLRSGGAVIVLMPNKASLVRPFLPTERWFYDPTHINVMSTRRFMRLLKANGYHSIWSRVGIPMFLQWRTPSPWLAPYFRIGQFLRRAIWLQDLLFWSLTSTPLSAIRDVMFVSAKPGDSPTPV